jgi:hypothetical protein
LCFASELEPLGIRVRIVQTGMIRTDFGGRNLADADEPFADRAGGWLDLTAQASELHPITRACLGFHLWSLAGLGQQGDRMEAAVTSARIAASEGTGAVFAPLAMGGAGGAARWRPTR